MNTEWVVLRNSVAGTAAMPEERIVAALERFELTAVVETPSTVEEMRAAACEVVKSGRPVAVVGGDGTVSAVVDALLQATTPTRPVIAVLPAGTGCDLVRTFGIPQVIEEAARHLSTPHTYDIDVGRLDGEWGTRHFVNVADSGLAAAVVAASARLPRRLGSSRYAVGVAVASPRFQACEVEIKTPRRTHRQTALLFIAANGQFFAGGWNVAPKALLVDGELDTQLIDVPKTAIPRLLPRLVRGVHLSHPGVRRRSLAEFTFTPELDWPVEVDGDVIGSGAFEASVVGQAVALKI